MLARREHCRAEMRRKLAARGFSGAVIEPVVARLVREGWLSDRRFAEQFLAARLRRGESPWLAARRARERGVDEAALAEALAGAEATFDVRAACRELIARRDPQGLRHRDERVWQRLARFLRNKGFDAATILRCLNEQAEETGEDIRD
ncbi:MAG: regulatory protein RecX [Mariprofundaceae bacterium]